MPPRVNSRYSYTTAVGDDADVVHLYGESAYRYRDFDDNRSHVVKQGDTLFSLAARYFRGIERGEGLWWIIADFQPEPIHDPTITLTPGRVIIIPSLRTVLEEIMHERRRRSAS